ncbi:MAG: Gfo/Idh/MocA family oxidoreductase [Acidobacteriia bacterium]|nr:Gfo/Idh/MocA family oxidoreductase [Terriglobia bacterium]
MRARLRWGILGTGNIARQFALAMAHSRRGELAAVGSRASSSASAFAVANHVPRACGSYEAVLADLGIDAVYIPLPNSMHHEWTIRALRAGKHVLCEKPIAANREEAAEMFDVARRTGRVLIEAFMYRAHPLTAAWLQQVRGGTIGRPLLVRSSFCFCARHREGNIRFDPAMAGGALMDVGCYCINLSRLIAGAEPVSVTASAKLSQAGIDEITAGALRFADGMVATFTCGLTVHADNAASICGSLGYIEVPIPWKPPLKEAVFVRSSSVPAMMDVGNKLESAPVPGSSPQQVITVDSSGPPLALEADNLAAVVFEGAAAVVSEADSLGNMAVLDKLRRCAGLEY